MGNKDYTDWGGKKRKLERKFAEEEARQKERKPKGKKRKNKDSVTHRLNDAEVLVCDLARCLVYFVQQKEKELSKQEGREPNRLEISSDRKSVV